MSPRPAATGPGLDIAALVAVDVHAHVETDEHGHLSLPDDLVAASSKYFSADHRAPTIDQTAQYYRERQMAVVLFTVDAESANGHPALSNEKIAEHAARHSDVVIPFASIDPAKGHAGARTLRRLVTKHGMRGIKFHPSIQNFAPDDGSAYPLLEAAQELGVPAIFHTGQTGIGAGLPGGRGIRLAHSNPMLLDEVAATFPDLTIVMAHPSFPWQDEALAVATHKANVYIDLSGWSPKYFPPQLVRYANSLLQDKVMFGSDYPLITPDRWLADFAEIDIKDHIRPKILKENAVRVFGLAPEEPK
ncbi:4-hydroxyphenyl-beta-ketoacyl-CoA hydrolase [Frankia sp. QA3]|uniref:4-hydroxyphenyl-beta-ketoacyl-CoA hydrolase n=1 Tax=Frankia sp. QA3 TaxID=710111 RepID=UPI000269BE00|nr:4-hydroxyphenyl-beta-ketoacyl-CoA hydrolase [Frankia sp. QA3]EIV92845.1 putative TIM-barrel fold metal-dependent hydrolase [Frankia sp. QA3]